MPEARTRSSRLWFAFFAVVVMPVMPLTVAVFLYRVDLFDPWTIPVVVSKHNDHILQVTERIGVGLLPGPEDIVYEAESRVIYTGCDDGWIKRINLTELAVDTTVENWVHVVGGRPLGLAFGPDKELVVADSYKGLLKVTREGTIRILTNEADGLKFGLTNGVDVASNGMIYFTDASYYQKDYLLEVLGGQPHGRFMSYDPSTNRTKVLVRGLYFANGVAISPQQDFVVFCETALQRCRKYYIEGENKGSIDNFVDNLPGYPDNIHFDGNGQFWIGLITGNTLFWNALKYPWIKKTLAIFGRYVKILRRDKDGGVVAVNLDGEVIALYSDPGLSLVTSGVQIENHLYYGSIVKSYIGQLDLK